MKNNTTHFKKVTPEILYDITLSSAQSKSKKVYIFEKGNLTDLVGEKRAEKLRKEFLKNNIKVKQIGNSPTFSKFSENDEFINNVMLFRYVPKSIFKADYEICIFDDIVAIYNEKSYILIQDKFYADMQVKLFEGIWDQGQTPVLDFDYKPKDSYYNCFRFSQKGIPIVVWPDLDAKISYSGMNQTDIEQYIANIIDNDFREYEGVSYIICFIWSMDGKKMLDVWRFATNYVDDRSGPLGDNIIYKESEKIENIEIASGSTLLILGYEEKMRRQSKNLQEYIEGDVPKIPLEIVNGKDFFE